MALAGGKSSSGVGIGEKATVAVKSTGRADSLLSCSSLCWDGSGEESCATSCQSQCRFRSRHRLHGFASSHFSLDEAHALQAWDTRLCFATDELLLRLRSLSCACPAACRFRRSLHGGSMTCHECNTGTTYGRANPLSQTSQMYGFSLVCDRTWRIKWSARL